MLVTLAIAAYIYTVKPGDNLWAISPRHNWGPVCQENHLANCNLIYPGQKLRIGGKVVSNPARLSGTRNVAYNTTLGGTLGCSGLESLWKSAGGNSGSAFIAAEIAMAESGGDQYAAGDGGHSLGYWQINDIHGSLSTTNAYGNARAAVIISDNGNDWSPWTTYVTGAYIGRCLGQ
jgi:LysM repeat protein